jgi:NAD(P)-dependent dehydrogenase (short-subunit alcohol dehydrogenase family)
MDIRGKVAIVTGGASAPGPATVKSLHDRGAAVVVVDLPSSDGKAVAADLDNVAFAAADVR